MRIYLRYLRSECAATLLYALFLLVCAYIMIVIFPSIAKIQMMEDYFDAMPAFLKAFIGQDVVNITTLEGFLTVEYFNTTWLLVMGVFNEQRQAAGATIAVFFTLYIFNVIALLLEQYPLLKRFSLFQYYDASKIFRQQAIQWADMAILLGVFSLMFGASIVT